MGVLRHSLNAVPLLVQEESYVIRMGQSYTLKERFGEPILLDDLRHEQIGLPYREWWEPIEDEL